MPKTWLWSKMVTLSVEHRLCCDSFLLLSVRIKWNEFFYFYNEGEFVFNLNHVLGKSIAGQHLLLRMKVGEENLPLYFLILCWPCISIYLFINNNQLDALNFIISSFQASTCFEHMCSSSGGQIALYSLWYQKLYNNIFALLTMSTCARNM